MMPTVIWLIEKLWTDSLENEVSAVAGYAPAGFVLTEAEADTLIREAGNFTGKCWALNHPTPILRKRKIERLTV